MMRFKVLKKYLDGILSTKSASKVESVEDIRNYYRDKWNDYFLNKNRSEQEFILDKGDWISDSKGVFGVGEGFTDCGSIKCSGKGESFTINLNQNTIKHERSDISYNCRVLSILSNSKCEIKNGILKSENVLNRGAAIYVDVNSSLYCNMCSFENNNTDFSGGAIYCCELSDTKLFDCKFKNNFASGFGGAIFVETSSSFECINSEFVENTSRFAQGGAVFFEQNCENILFKNVKFINNISKSNGEAIFVCNNSNLECLNCYFEQDCDEEKHNELIFSDEYSNVKLTGCKIKNHKPS